MWVTQATCKVGELWGGQCRAHRTRAGRWALGAQAGGVPGAGASGSSPGNTGQRSRSCRPRVENSLESQSSHARVGKSGERNDSIYTFSLI